MATNHFAREVGLIPVASADEAVQRLGLSVREVVPLSDQRNTHARLHIDLQGARVLGQRPGWLTRAQLFELSMS